VQSIKEIALNLKPGDDGVWVASNRSKVSYPDDGNQTCFQVEDFSFWFRHRNNCIISTMRQYPPSGAVLDIGGGNGFVSSAIKKAGMEPILLEPGDIGVLNARARGLAPIIHSTLQDAGFKPDSVPAAGLFDVLEHIEEDVAFLTCLKKILKPGGRVYLTVPAYGFLFSDEDREAGHYRRYTRRSLSECLASAGFEVEFASYIFALLPLPVFLFRTLPSNFPRRDREKISKVRSQHSGPPNIFGKLLNALFACETWLITKNIPLPFGGSCMLVARKPR
jgi:SAM-dependent methyltransferase